MLSDLNKHALRSALNQLSVGTNELEKSERLVEDALRLVSSVQVLDKAEKGSIEGRAAGAAPAVLPLLGDLISRQRMGSNEAVVVGLAARRRPYVPLQGKAPRL